MNTYTIPHGAVHQPKATDTQKIHAHTRTTTTPCYTYTGIRRFSLHIDDLHTFGHTHMRCVYVYPHLQLNLHVKVLCIFKDAPKTAKLTVCLWGPYCIWFGHARPTTVHTHTTGMHTHARVITMAAWCTVNVRMSNTVYVFTCCYFSIVLAHFSAWAASSCSSLSISFNCAAVAFFNALRASREKSRKTHSLSSVRTLDSIT